MRLAERFEAFHLKTWKNDAAFAALLKSLGHILPLRKPSDLTSAATRARIHALTSDVKAGIFSGDDLVLPLVSTTQTARRRLQPRPVSG